MSAMVGGKQVEHRINGWNQALIQGTGHGITDDVPEALWNAWYEQFKGGKLVKNGFIFAHKQKASVKAEAAEKAKNKAGTEKLPQAKASDKEGVVGKADA